MKTYVVIAHEYHSGMPTPYESVVGTFSHQAQAINWCYRELDKDNLRTHEPVRVGNSIEIMGDALPHRMKRFTISEHYNDKLIGVVS